MSFAPCADSVAYGRTNCPGERKTSIPSSQGAPAKRLNTLFTAARTGDEDDFGKARGDFASLLTIFSFARSKRFPAPTAAARPHDEAGGFFCIAPNTKQLIRTAFKVDYTWQKPKRVWRIVPLRCTRLLKSSKRKLFSTCAKTVNLTDV
ncbi:MAG: hypothetical protein AAGC95_16185 [Pseudomonadota bacterium]